METKGTIPAGARNGYATYRVMILREGDHCTIWPGSQLAQVGDVVVFNPVGTDIKLMFPDPALFGRSEIAVLDQALEPLVVQGVGTGPYPYAIYCAATRSFATASAPRIIIYQ